MPDIGPCNPPTAWKNLKYMIINRLQVATLESRFVGIYQDIERPTVFSAGRARVCNEEITILSGVTKEGLEDGLVVVATPYIFKIEEETEYLRSLSALWHHYGAKSPDFEEALPVESISSFEDLFNKIQPLGLIVSLWANEDSINEVCGVVAKVQDGFVLINGVSANGDPDGFTTLRIDQVQHVNVGGVDERRRNLVRQLLQRSL